MKITDCLILPEDVYLLEVSSLPQAEKDKLDYQEGDYIVSRKRSRTYSKLIDGKTAGFLRCFKEGNSIVEAVIQFAKNDQQNPETVLEQIYPVVKSLIDNRLLVTESDKATQKVEPQYAEGEGWGEGKIERIVQVLDDSEVGGFKMLKNNC